MNRRGHKKNRCRFMVGRQRQRLKGSDTVLPYPNPTPNKHSTLARSKLSILTAWYKSNHPKPEPLAGSVSVQTNRLVRPRDIKSGVTPATPFDDKQINSKPPGGTRQAQRFAGFSELLRSNFIASGLVNTGCPIGVEGRRNPKLLKVLDGQPQGLQRVLRLSKVLAYRRTYSGFAIISELLISFCSSYRYVLALFLASVLNPLESRRNPTGLIISHSHTLSLEV